MEQVDPRIMRILRSQTQRINGVSWKENMQSKVVDRFVHGLMLAFMVLHTYIHYNAISYIRI